MQPKFSEPHTELGRIALLRRDVEKARAELELAVRLSPESFQANEQQALPSPWPAHNLGYLLLRTGETAKAEEALRESLKYDGHLTQTHYYYLGRTLEKEERSAEAIEEYQLAVVGDPTSADACYSLAMLYRKLKREDEAKAMFEEFRKRKGMGSARASEPR